MKQSSALNSLLLAAMLIISYSASADVVGWGAATRNSTLNSCSSSCTGAAFAEDGGEGIVRAAATENTFGTSRGEVNLNNPLSTYLPTLKAESLASASGGAFATVSGVQGFTYTGLTAKTITLTLNLDVFLDINGF